MLAAVTLLSTLALIAGEGVGHNKVLNFPSGDNTANFLRFNPDIEETSAFTVCAWLRKTTSDSSRYWFSYAISGQDNEIIVGEGEPGTVAFYIQNTKIITPAGLWPVNAWTHICASWDASTKVVIMINGEVKASQDGFKAGGAIRAGGSLVIGQEQDNVGGGFDATQSYQGDVYNLNLWQYALSEEEVAFLFTSGRCGYGETEDDPKVPYSVFFGQEPQGDAKFVDGSCMDLEDSSVGKVLRFPPQSDISTSNYVQFTADFGADSLDSLSICFWYFKVFSDTSRYFFSYAVPGDDNAIIVGEQSGKLGLWIRRVKYLSDAALEQQTWYHICTTWSSESGMAIHVNGEKVGESSLGIGKSVPSGGILTLGQEQDSLGGGFDINQAFAGSIYNLNVFNVQLSDDEVAQVYSDGTICEMVPEQFWTDDKIAISYNTISSMVPAGNAVFESGEPAWRHGAQHCAKEDIDVDGHNPECWKMLENKRFKDKTAIGNVVVLDIDTAKAACYATKTCKALTCQDLDGEVKCEMKTSFKKTKKSSKHTSYTFVC